MTDPIPPADQTAPASPPVVPGCQPQDCCGDPGAHLPTGHASVDRAAAPVCICGHPEERHFEDVCQTCGCGDYLEPRDAAEVIARWRQAALKARADRAAVLREAADALPEADLPFVPPLDRRRVADWLRRLAVEVSDQTTAQHHTVGGDRYLCHSDDHYCPDSTTGEYGADATAVLPADRAADEAVTRALGVLRVWRDERETGPEAARLLYEVGAALTEDSPELRRLADETQPTEAKETAEPDSPEKVVRQHVTTLHLIGEQLAEVESWMWARLADIRAAGARQDGAQPLPEGPEYAPCTTTGCGHIEPDHQPNAGSCAECGCTAYRPEAPRRS